LKKEIKKEIKKEKGKEKDGPFGGKMKTAVSPPGTTSLVTGPSFFFLFLRTNAQLFL
jgi:hypothetical protein